MIPCKIAKRPGSGCNCPHPVFTDSFCESCGCPSSHHGNGGNEWWRKGFGMLSVATIISRLGPRGTDGIIHTGGIISGHWLTWPGSEGAPVRELLSMYQSEDEFLNDKY